jgi:hypothetical protein
MMKESIQAGSPHNYILDFENAHAIFLRVRKPQSRSGRLGVNEHDAIRSY